MTAETNQRRQPGPYRPASIALLAVFILGIVAWASPRSSTAGALDPVGYLPLVRQEAPTRLATPTARPSATPTATQAPSQTLTISGTTFLRPAYRTISQTVDPNAYLVILDVTASMSWNFAGHGWRNGQAIQCGPGPNRQHCGADDAWPTISERRVYAAKQAIISLIDSMLVTDTMRLVVFSTDGITATSSWSSDRTLLRQAVLQVGAYAGDPYLTSGEAPIASALYRARQLMAQLPHVSPDGQPYRARALLLTDSVANSMLVGDGDWLYDPATYCPGVEFPEDFASCYVGYIPGSPPTPRPITAMIEQASLLQQATVVFVIALGGVDITGLPNVASAPNAPYFSTAQSAAALSDVALELGAHSISYVCTPHVAPTWLNTVDAAHLPDPAAGPPGLSATVVGYISLYNEHGNPLPGDQGHAPVRRNPQTGYLSYTVAGLAPGTYQMGLFVAYKGDDTITRLYPLLYTSAGTHDQRLTFVLAPASGVSLAVLPPVYLDLDGSACPAAS